MFMNLSRVFKNNIFVSAIAFSLNAFLWLNSACAFPPPGPICPSGNLFYLDSDSDGIRDNTTGVYDCSAELPGYTLNINGPDNCPEIANETQSNHDNDSQGDDCDLDDDNDTVNDIDDCSPLDNTLWQDGWFYDGDGDGVRDAFTNTCLGNNTSNFTDNPNGQDNCPEIYNSNQIDTDNDNAGDACDDNDDNDSVADEADCAPTDSTRWNNIAFSDPDNDGIRTDDSDREIDCFGENPPSNYTINQNGPDNCPLTANITQLDNDHDSQGDICDPDDDNDTIPDSVDCNSIDDTKWRNQAYPDQDLDGIRDAISLDSIACFGLTPPNGYVLTETGPDNCPNIANSNQSDQDSDGIGDTCDDTDNREPNIDPTIYTRYLPLTSETKNRALAIINPNDFAVDFRIKFYNPSTRVSRTVPLMTLEAHEAGKWDLFNLLSLNSDFDGYLFILPEVSSETTIPDDFNYIAFLEDSAQNQTTLKSNIKSSSISIPESNFKLYALAMSSNPSPMLLRPNINKMKISNELMLINPKSTANRVTVSVYNSKGSKLCSKIVNMKKYTTNRLPIVCTNTTNNCLVEINPTKPIAAFLLELIKSTDTPLYSNFPQALTPEVNPIYSQIKFNPQENISLELVNARAKSQNVVIKLLTTSGASIGTNTIKIPARGNNLISINKLVSASTRDIGNYLVISIIPPKGGKIAARVLTNNDPGDWFSPANAQDTNYYGFPNSSINIGLFNPGRRSNKIIFESHYSTALGSRNAFEESSRTTITLKPNQARSINISAPLCSSNHCYPYLAIFSSSNLPFAKNLQ